MYRPQYATRVERVLRNILHQQPRFLLGSTRVYSVSQFPSTGWVFGPASDPTAKDIPLYSFQNPTYSTATLNDKDPFA